MVLLWTVFVAQPLAVLHAERITGVECAARQGMPLIRYRTGDVSRFLPGGCGCGTLLRRLERVRFRWPGRVALTPTHFLTMADLDDVLFPLAGAERQALAALPAVQAARMGVVVEIQQGGPPPAGKRKLTRTPS